MLHLSLLCLSLTAGGSVLPSLDDTVVYEANLRAFGPSGGFEALSRRLDAIHRIGCNVLWLMPVQPIGKLRSAGGLGSPYSVAGYDGVNPEFGTPEELRRLIRRAHDLRVAVILDWVANHTAWDHPWVASHPKWYTHDEAGQIVSPPGTNWNDVADLNYDDPAMRRAMIDSMRRWVTAYDIDGFRCDAADYVPQGFWAQAISTLRSSARKPLLFLGEGSRPDLYDSGFDLLYGWEFYFRLREVFRGGKATTLAEAAASETAKTLSRGRRLRFTSNHDESAFQGTPLDFYGNANGVETAFLVTALYGGAPMVYCGQEVAWEHRVPIFERSSVEWKGGQATERWVASLFRLRREHVALRHGATKDYSTEDALVFERRTRGDRVLVFANVRDHAAAIATEPSLRGEWHDGWTGRRFTVPPTLVLPPFGNRLLVRPARAESAAGHVPTHHDSPHA